MNTALLHWHKSMLLIAVLVFAGCSGTKNTSSSGQNSPDIVDSGYQMGAAGNANQSNIMVDSNKGKPSNLSLVEMLRRLPGVRVSGTGAYSKFTVDGTSQSFMAGTDPLFVVNGNAMGTDYSYVHTMVDPKTVVSTSVLKGADAAIYGSRGANGVILIRTKQLK